MWALFCFDAQRIVFIDSEAIISLCKFAAPTVVGVVQLCDIAIAKSIIRSTYRTQRKR